MTESCVYKGAPWCKTQEGPCGLICIDDSISDCVKPFALEEQGHLLNGQRMGSVGVDDPARWVATVVKIEAERDAEKLQRIIYGGQVHSCKEAIAKLDGQLAEARKERNTLIVKISELQEQCDTLQDDVLDLTGDPEPRQIEETVG